MVSLIAPPSFSINKCVSQFTLDSHYTHGRYVLFMNIIGVEYSSIAAICRHCSSYSGHCYLGTGRAIGDSHTVVGRPYSSSSSSSRTDRMAHF